MARARPSGRTAARNRTGAGAAPDGAGARARHAHRRWRAAHHGGPDTYHGGCRRKCRRAPRLSPMERRSRRRHGSMRRWRISCHRWKTLSAGPRKISSSRSMRPAHSGASRWRHRFIGAMGCRLTAINATMQLGSSPAGAELPGSWSRSAAAHLFGSSRTRRAAFAHGALPGRDVQDRGLQAPLVPGRRYSRARTRPRSSPGIVRSAYASGALPGGACKRMQAAQGRAGGKSAQVLRFVSLWRCSEPTRPRILGKSLPGALPKLTERGFWRFRQDSLPFGKFRGHCA